MAYRGWDGAASNRAEEYVWPTAPVAPSHAQHPDRTRPAAAYAPGPPLVPQLPHCTELDCVRHLLTADVLALAERRAIDVDVGADNVLIAWGFISDQAYSQALAASFGVRFEPLVGPLRLRSRLPGSLNHAVLTGVLECEADGNGIFVVAPRLADSRRLMPLLTSSEAARRIRLTTAARLQDFVKRHTTSDIERIAARELLTARPEFSAGSGFSRRMVVTLYAAALALIAMSIPGPLTIVVEAAVGAVFVAWTALRLLGLLSERFTSREPQNFTDDWLPTYSVIVALYRETRAVPGLVAALDGLDYPREKLDLKIVLEPDDLETRNAVAGLQLGPPFDVIVAPAAGPRTKPKALNAALPFVRGEFVAVFDAEDRPEPEQLRLALEAFVANDERLACVQARLTIDNTADTWLTRLFTAEYAGLFDVFLPGLSMWSLPLPLGGSSNHFRTEALREAGAWDPYNVTEDADLGMRLARLGYRASVISSTTYEEAPARLRAWMKQRTRWFKGWMQTWLVHMRSPRRLVADLGWTGFAVFQLLVGGTVLAALVHGLFAARLGWRLATAPLPPTVDDWLGLDVAILLCGYGVSIVLGIVGLARRGLVGCAWALLLMPVYWLLLSCAAWRALFQLLRDPYRWEKTEHGLARTSRRARQAQR